MRKKAVAAVRPSGRARRGRKHTNERGATQDLGGLRVIAERKATGGQRGTLVLTARTETTGPTAPMVPTGLQEIGDRKGTPVLLVPRVTEGSEVLRVRPVSPDHGESEA